MKNIKQIKESKRDFYLVVVGQVISILGAALLRFALSLYVLDITGRADVYATLYAISSIPLLLSPLGGVIADRFSRRNLMVIFDFINSGIVLVFVFFIFAGNTSVVVVGLIMVLLSSVSAMYAPTVSASIPQLVGKENLEQANGLVNGVQALANVVAPVLGGVLYGILGIKILAIVSCIAFLLSAIMETQINIPFVKRELEGHIFQMIGKDMKVGFRYVIKETLIFKSMIIAALLNLILTPFFVVGVPVILRVTMKSTDTMYGVGMGLVNFATILGALSIGLFAKKMRMKSLYRWILIIALLMIPMALAATPLILQLGYYPPFILFMLCGIPIAMIMTIISIFVMTKIQKKTPNENLGKVMALVTAVSQCAAPIGQIVCGVIFQKLKINIYVPILLLATAMLIVTGVTREILKNEKEGI